eukprot:6141505-Heterocapsa_arctica.AAC.1
MVASLSTSWGHGVSLGLFLTGGGLLPPSRAVQDGDCAPRGLSARHCCLSARHCCSGWRMCRCSVGTARLALVKSASVKVTPLASRSSPN